MVKAQLCKPEFEDLQHIAENIRPSDLRELQAVHGFDVDVLGILVRAVNGSVESKVAITAFGEPIALFGVACTSLLTGSGCPWLLGTPELDKRGREIVAITRDCVSRWGAQFNKLENYVDARNNRSIVWLKRSGFTMAEAKPYGREGMLFHRFERCT